MLGFRFTKYYNKNSNKEWDFDQIKDLFLELLLHTSGDVDEAFDWLKEIDAEHGIFNENYSLSDFKKDLDNNNFFKDGPKGGSKKLSAGTEKLFRKKAFEQIFGKVKRGDIGSHRTSKSGGGLENGDSNKPFEYGDNPNDIDYAASMSQASFMSQFTSDTPSNDNPWLVKEKMESSSYSTVVMIDISHSMILYGEDRITPAKKVALALAQFIQTKYPKDSIDFVVFGNDAWEVSLADLPYLQVGPYHTNTVAGLQKSMEILRKRKNPNRQIFMITDGKPTCLKEGKHYYKNSSYGHDPKIINKCLNLARQCRKLKIPVTTFMIASDPYLQSFVEQFTKANSGKAFYSGLDGLGQLIFEDYERNKRKNL